MQTIVLTILPFLALAIAGLPEVPAPTVECQLKLQKCINGVADDGNTCDCTESFMYWGTSGIFYSTVWDYHDGKHIVVDGDCYVPHDFPSNCPTGSTMNPCGVCVTACGQDYVDMDFRKTCEYKQPPIAAKPAIEVSRTDPKLCSQEFTCPASYQRRSYFMQDGSEESDFQCCPRGDDSCGAFMSKCGLEACCVKVDGICDANPCGDYGVCAVKWGEAVCTCNAGYELVDGVCTAIGACEGNPCGDNAACSVDGEYQPVCTCDEGFNEVSGRCVIDPCVDTKCGDHGACAVKDAKATCICYEGYKQLDGICVAITACEGNPCGDNAACTVDSSYQPVCACDKGYDEVDGKCVIDPCVDTKCGDYGSCAVEDGKATCNCNEGYELVDGICAAISACEGNPCGDNALCTVGGDYQPVCTCDEDYNEVDGKCVIDPCVDTKCGNYGACAIKDGKATCNCNEGYELVDGICAAISACKGNPCGDNALCTVDSDYQPVCTCDKDYKEVDGKCVIDPCVDTKCGGYGACALKDGKATCNCNEGYELVDGICAAISACEGNPCGVIKDYNEVDGKCVIDPCVDAKCGDYGTCAVKDEKAICNCNAGYKLVNGVCAAISACEDNPCGDNAVCTVDSDYQPVCTCDKDYNEVDGKCTKNVPKPPAAIKPVPVEPRPEPVDPKLVPIHSKPVPVDPKPEHVASRPEPVESKPKPVEPPVATTPVPVEPKHKPEPVEVKVVPVEPSPAPVNSKPKPVAIKPEPVDPKLVPVEHKPKPVEPKPEPTNSTFTCSNVGYACPTGYIRNSYGVSIVTSFTADCCERMPHPVQEYCPGTDTPCCRYTNMNSDGSSCNASIKCTKCRKVTETGSKPNGLHCGDVKFRKCKSYKTDMKCCRNTDKCGGWGNCKCASTSCCKETQKSDDHDRIVTDSGSKYHGRCDRDGTSKKCKGFTRARCCKAGTDKCGGYAKYKCSSSHCCSSTKKAKDNRCRRGHGGCNGY